MTVEKVNKVKGVIIGSILVATGQIGAACSEAIGKSSGLTVIQLLTGRVIVHIVASILWWNVYRPKNLNNWYGDKPHITNIWLRAVILSLTAFGFYTGILTLPLGDLQCLFYTAPLLTVFFGNIWLKEKLPKWYILIPTTLLTIFGVIFVSQPSFIIDNIDPDNKNDSESLRIDGIIAVTLAAFGWATCTLLIRKALSAHFLQLEFSMGICILVVAIPLIGLLNQVLLHDDFIGNVNIMDGDSWKYDIVSIISMLSIGVLGFFVIFCSVKGYQYGEATMVSWLEYTTIPISFLSQTFIFNDIPNIWELFGAIMVLIGALLPFFHQIFHYFTLKKTESNTREMEEEDGAITEEVAELINLNSESEEN